MKCNGWEWGGVGWGSGEVVVSIGGMWGVEGWEYYSGGLSLLIS